MRRLAAVLQVVGDLHGEGHAPEAVGIAGRRGDPVPPPRRQAGGSAGLEEQGRLEGVGVAGRHQTQRLEELAPEIPEPVDLAVLVDDEGVGRRGGLDPRRRDLGELVVDALRLRKIKSDAPVKPNQMKSTETT